MANGDFGSQYFMGIAIGYQEGATRSTRSLLTVDYAAVTVSQIRAYAVDGGTLYLAPYPTTTGYLAVITITLANALGRQWRVLQFGSGTITQARMDDGRSWALVLIANADATAANMRIIQTDGASVTVVETGVTGYRALLALNPSDFTGTPRVGYLFGAQLAQAAVTGGFALLTAGFVSIAYLLRDEFTTAAIAPLASPRICEPGPGSLTLVQLDQQFSIAADALVFLGQLTPAWGDQGAYMAAGLARVPGRTLISTWNYSVTFGSASIPVAWFTGAALNTTGSNNMAEGIGVTAAALFAQVPGSSIGGANSLATDYTYALWLLGTGAYYFVKGGTYTVWTLIYTSAVGNQATLYPGWSNFNAGGLDKFIHVRDFGVVANSTAALAALTAAYPN